MQARRGDDWWLALGTEVVPKSDSPGELCRVNLVYGLAGTRGRTIRLVVRVRARQEVREVEPAEEVPKEQRGVVWARWWAEGRYRSGAELARAAGVSRETVSAAVWGKG